MKIVFMGTPDFAVPCLEALYNSGNEVAAVYTQTDKPKGRGHSMAFSPVKELALQHEIPVFQPPKLKNNEEAFNELNALSPDLIVVVAYGKILPQNILDIPKYGCINVHASLLPKYRGAAPIQWSVINGEKVTGVTTMYMDAGIDTGDILLTDETEIGENETAEELRSRLSFMGAKLLLNTIEQIKSGALVRKKQDDANSCYAPMLDRSMSCIDWSDTALNIHNKVRGLYPWPSASTTVNGKTLKILQTRISDISGKPGDILSLSPFVIGCGSGSLEICEVQLEGKRRMSVSDFLRGNKINSDKLGE